MEMKCVKGGKQEHLCVSVPGPATLQVYFCDTSPSMAFSADIC